MVDEFIDATWNFNDAVTELSKRHAPGGYFSGPQRNLMVEAWARIVGRSRAVAELDAAIAGYSSISAAAKAFRMTTSTLRRFQQSFAAMPEVESTRGVITQTQVDQGGPRRSDRYITRFKIDSGGFGDVYEVERRSDGLICAKKVLREDGADALARFRREIGLINKLEHSGIIKLLDFDADSEPPWYVMPKYQRSLAQLMPEIAGDDSRVRPLYNAILDAVEFAHAHEVIHRDIKPNNVLMNAVSDLVLTDFGHGRGLSSAASRLTRTINRLGTDPYAAPELYSDAKNADLRADIYSLGRLLYELYGGSVIGTQDPEEVPVHIYEIVAKATKNRSSDRYPSVAALREHYLRTLFRSGDGTTSLPGRVIVAPTRRSFSLHEGRPISHFATVAILRSGFFSNGNQPGIWIGYIANDDARECARRLREAFAEAGWQTFGNDPPAATFDGPFDGIRFNVWVGPRGRAALPSEYDNRLTSVREALMPLGEVEELESSNDPEIGGMMGSIVVGLIGRRDTSGS